MTIYRKAPDSSAAKAPVGMAKPNPVPLTRAQWRAIVLEVIG